MPPKMALSLLPLLLLSIIKCHGSSPYWHFSSNNAGNWDQQRINNAGGWDQQRIARAQRLITLGRYSERDGDRDMLDMARAGGGQQQQPQQERQGRMATANGQSVPSIWGFSPNFGQPKGQGPWTSEQGGQNGMALRRPLYDQQVQPSFPMANASPDQIARPLVPVRVPIAPSPSSFGQILPNTAGHRAIDRFDVNLDRFATGPPPGSVPNRIVLPPNFFERLSQGISTEGRNWPKRTGISEGNVVPGSQFGQVEKPNGDVEVPKTRILTNERIPLASGTRPMPIEPVKTSGGNGQMSGPVPAGNSDQPVPALPDFRHEDIRPEADGERLGQQWKFSGATNQYREDLGKEFSRNEQRMALPVGEPGPKRVSTGEGPANAFIGTGFNPAPEGAQLFIGEKRPSTIGGQSHGIVPPLSTEGRGKMAPYVSAPEELTGSRWRSIDEHFNALAGGNAGRGPNRYVKVDLLNE